MCIRVYTQYLQLPGRCAAFLGSCRRRHLRECGHLQHNNHNNSNNNNNDNNDNNNNNNNNSYYYVRCSHLGFQGLDFEQGNLKIVLETSGDHLLTYDSSRLSTDISGIRNRKTAVRPVHALRIWISEGLAQAGSHLQGGGVSPEHLGQPRLRILNPWTRSQDS